MTTGPYDLGPFQTLTAISFPQGRPILYAQNRFSGLQPGKYDVRREIWSTLDTTGWPGNLQHMSWDPVNSVWYSALSTGVIYRYDPEAETWTFVQSNPITAGATFAIATDVVKSLGVAFLARSAPREFWSWAPGSAAQKIADIPAAWTDPGSGSNHVQSVWDAERERILLFGRQFVSPNMTYVLRYFTPGGASGDIFTLPSNYNGTFQPNFAGPDSDPTGRYWFYAKRYSDNTFQICTYDGTFTEKKQANPSVDIVFSGIYQRVLDRYVLSDRDNTNIWEYDEATDTLALLGGVASPVGSAVINA